MKKSKTNMIPFSPPDISKLEINNVVKVLKSGWITTGPRTKEFEEKISKFIGTERTVCLNSATAALELSLRLLGIGDGDEVITTAYTYSASASVIAHVGAKIIFIDCQKDNCEMDYYSLKKSITKNTKAIIAVDIAGIPCNYDKIFSIVNEKRSYFSPKNKLQKEIGRIAVISDAAHAFGAYIKSNGKKMVGNIADFTSFSFHAVKNLTTGEGGALTWKTIKNINNDDIYKQIQLYSLHGQNKDAFHKNSIGSWEYDIVEPFYKFNMTDISSAIGLAQLKRYDKMLSKRKKIIKIYDNILRKHNIYTLNHFTDTYSSSGHLYITRIPNISDNIRRDIIFKMAKKGIIVNVHYKPLPMMSAYIKMGFNIDNYPNSFDFYLNEITLPLYSKLTFSEAKYIANTYCQIVDEVLYDKL